MPASATASSSTPRARAPTSWATACTARTAAVLRRNGHDDNGWGEHVARRFEPSWFDEYDLVLPVDHVHVERLEQIARNDADRAKLRLFRSFDPDAVAAGELGMDDPWYGTDPAYDQTYAEITAAVPGIVEHVRAELEARDRRLSPPPGGHPASAPPPLWEDGRMAGP